MSLALLVILFIFLNGFNVGVECQSGWANGFGDDNVGAPSYLLGLARSNCDQFCQTLVNVHDE
jgi:hypothetical protein